LERNIQLEELAGLSGIYLFYFLRCFKGVTGFTPHQFLLRMRVQKARTLIPNKESLTTIAYVCGFADQAHFTRIFKAQTGMTLVCFGNLRLSNY